MTTLEWHTGSEDGKAIAHFRVELPDIVFGEVIGAGTRSTIYEVTYKGKKCAAKVMKHLSEKEYEEYKQHMKQMSDLKVGPEYHAAYKITAAALLDDEETTWELSIFVTELFEGNMYCLYESWRQSFEEQLETLTLDASEESKSNHATLLTPKKLTDELMTLRQILLDQKIQFDTVTPLKVVCNLEQDFKVRLLDVTHQPGGTGWADLFEFLVPQVDKAKQAGDTLLSSLALTPDMKDQIQSTLNGLGLTGLQGMLDGIKVAKETTETAGNGDAIQDYAKSLLGLLSKAKS